MKTLLIICSLLFINTTMAEERPNIIVFLVDDMGVMDTSAPFLTDKSGKIVTYELNKFYKTPGMVQLAKQGLVFNQFYANSVCSPSRASIMTGQSSARHGTTQFISPDKKNTGKNGPKAWNWKGLTQQSITLPRILQKSGYHTIHCGKAHFAPKKHEGENPLKLGFDVNIAGCAYGRPSSYYGMEAFGKGKNRAIPGLDKYHGKDIFLTEALTIEMNLAITKAVKEKKPFFAYMSHYAVHAPFQADQRFINKYKNSGKPKNAQAFATLIEGMDKSLVDIMTNLKKLGVAENTIIIFLGDNGSDAPLGGAINYGSAAPLKGKKGSAYEGGVRVPFIAAWAEPSTGSIIQKKFPIKPALIHDEFASITDLFPTILTLADAKMPKSHIIDGQNLLGYFAGKRKLNDQKFLMHFPHQHRSSYFTTLRVKQWKLIYNYLPKKAKYELYDLVNDPFEKNNQAKAQPQVLKSMITAMQNELKIANAQYPVAKDKSELKVK